MKTMVLGTGVLAVKMLVTNMYALFPSVWAGFGPPEDSWIWKTVFGKPAETLTHAGHQKGHPHHDTQAHQRHLRAQRVIMNDLENIPISLIVFWVAAVANPKRSVYVSKLFMIFVTARCAHSAIYLAGISGVRSVAFMAGFSATLRAMFLGVQGVMCKGNCKKCSSK